MLICVGMYPVVVFETDWSSGPMVGVIDDQKLWWVGAPASRPIQKEIWTDTRLFLKIGVTN